MPLLKPMLDTLEVMVEAMAVDTEAMVAMEAMEAIEAMERGLQKLKLVPSQDMDMVDMAVMVDMEVATMEDMDVDMVMARGPLMLRP